MTAITHSSRDQWLLARRELVTASDVPAILGMSERRDAIAVYLDKIGRGTDEESEVMARGRDFEEPIARAYARQTGRHVRGLGDFEMRVHPTIPWLAATPDRIVFKRVDELPGYAKARAAGSVSMDVDPNSVCGVLQLKQATGSRERWDEAPPEEYVVQTQIEIHCVGTTWGALAGMVDMHRPLVCVDLGRDDELLADALPHLERFRWHVKERIPPPPQGARSLPSVRRLYHGRSSGETITLDDYALDTVLRWKQAGIDELTNANLATRYEAELRALLGPDTYGELPDGSYIERHVTAHRDTLHHKRGRH